MSGFEPQTHERFTKKKEKVGGACKIEGNIRGLFMALASLLLESPNRKLGKIPTLLVGKIVPTKKLTLITDYNVGKNPDIFLNRVSSDFGAALGNFS